MSYLLPKYRVLDLPERGLDIFAKTDPGLFLVRSAKLLALRSEAARGLVAFRFEEWPHNVLASATTQMTFGDARQSEAITIRDYCYRVLERGDLLDLIASPASASPLEALWISVERIGSPEPNAAFQLKEDGLFALRTKAGEKAERWVGRQLAGAGHQFPAEALQSPGAFVIWFEGKRRRRPDLICKRCGVRFEVKKRNKDRRFRVSHSHSRPFQEENVDRDWHAFVFPDFEVRYVSNRAIHRVMADGRFRPGHDAHDGWADLDPSALVWAHSPPPCR